VLPIDFGLRSYRIAYVATVDVPRPLHSWITDEMH
jgi:hypothetical protein